MAGWALRIRNDDLGSLCALWRVPGVEALPQSNGIWLRGGDPDDATRRLLPTLPNEGRFEITEHGALIAPGQRVPLGVLPSGHWRPLRDLLELQLPQAKMAAQIDPAVQVDLVPCQDARNPNVLVTDFDVWYHYAIAAPQVRLNACEFAVSADRRALIRGSTLPPIPGTSAVETAGLVVPCGWTWNPPVDAAILARAWRIRAGDLCLIWPGKSLEVIKADQLVAASRSAVQLTRKAMQHG